MRKRWRSDITHEIGRCDQLANCLGDLAKGLAWAQGDLESSGAATVKEQFYFRLDQPFRLWLACIDPSWDEEERQKSITDWHKTILRLAREQGEDMVKQAGPVAFAGRSVSQTIGKGKNEKDRDGSLLCTGSVQPLPLCDPQSGRRMNLRREIMSVQW